MKMHCHPCGRILRLWEIRCPYCRQSAMNWLHIVLVSVFAVMTVIYLLKIF